MKHLLPAAFSALLVSAAYPGALSFTQAPSMTANGGSWAVSFALSDSTDVEVSIVDRTSGEIVRHLAAGMLGSSAPAPLVKGSLAQTMAWDGRDDYRQAVASTGNLTVRVRAGMSALLDNAAGGDPYEYTPTEPGGWIYGFARGGDGSIYVSWQSSGVTPITIRQFSATGVYLKTIFPIPGDKSVDAYTGWGLNLLTAISYSPKTQDSYGPLMTTSPLGYFGRPDFITAPSPGQLGILNDNSNSVFVMNEDGSCNAATVAAAHPFIVSPAIRGGMGYGLTGPRCLAGSTDRSYVLMAGTCNSFGADTGFYRDGRIWKIDRATGVTTVFFDLDTAQKGNSLKTQWIAGVAIDDSGYVFACDRLHNRIMVLNKTGALVKSIPAPAPDNVTWCRENGAVYATGRLTSLGLFLYKIADWRTDTALTINTRLVAAGNGTMSYLDAGWANRSFIITSQSTEGTLTWLGYRLGGIVLYKESGNAFVEYRNFKKLSTQNAPYIKRLAVDPRTETAYLCASGTPVYKVTDWRNPSFKPCTTLTGTTKRALTGYDLAVDPYRRNLFVRQIGTMGPFEGDIYRYTIGNYLTPAPLARLNTHLVVDSYCVRGTTSVGTADFGIAVAPNGHLAAMSALPYIGLTPTAVRYYPVYDTQAAYRPLVLINDIKIGGGGVGFDLKGNLYVGKPGPGTGSGLPSVITGDRSWKKSTGQIYKYNAPGSLDGNLFVTATAAPDKTYDVDFGQLGGGTMSLCDCMTASFGMDAWGRLYVPNGTFQKISVLDNEGNRTLRFGNYGNIDNVADELSGKPGTEGKCYMAYPFSVKASDHYIYAGDPGNNNVVRFKKIFVLDNMPTLAAQIPRIVTGPLALSTWPNPLIRGGNILVNLPSAGSLTLDLIDMGGRLVQRVASGPRVAGAHTFTWNGSRTATGVYFVRLRTGNGTLTQRIVLAR